MKVHTRAKRKYKLATHFRHKIGKAKLDKPKAFKSEEAAKNWAKKNNLKNFELINLRSSGKTKIKIRLLK